MAYTKVSSFKAKGRKVVRAKDAASPTKKHTSAAKRAARLMAARLKLKGHNATKPDIWIALADPETDGTRRLKFGRVVVANTVPDSATVWSNVDAGRQALKRATEVLSKPGVTLRLAAGVPRFRADPTQPGMLVRELNGTVQRGRIVNGSFAPVD